jgi:Fur family ferric uptake transcriptional regulator
MGIGSPVYETLREDNHHHLVCLNCKKVTELSDELVAPFFTRVEEENEMKLRTSHLVLFGICKHCQETNR